MIKRCNNPYTTRYENWGGRGIKVCERWLDFDNFYEDMIETYDPNLSLDRIDNDGDYEPNNCRWATVKEQALNRSSNRLLTYDGVVKHMSQWAEGCGYKQSTFKQRFYGLGWSLEKCLNTPVRKRG